MQDPSPLVHFTRATGSQATDLSATENTVRALTLPTVCTEPPVDKMTVAFPLLSLEDTRTAGRNRNHAVVSEFSEGRQSL
jgi:hypothetical protein